MSSVIFTAEYSRSTGLFSTVGFTTAADGKPADRCLADLTGVPGVTPGILENLLRNLGITRQSDWLDTPNGITTTAQYVIAEGDEPVKWWEKKA